MTPDERVNAWLLNKWIEESQNNRRWMRTRYNPDAHGPAESLTVITADGDWECGCYSEFTRDDQFILTAKIQTAAGPITYEYGHYGQLPDFIDELSDDVDNDVCPYENEDTA